MTMHTSEPAPAGDPQGEPAGEPTGEPTAVPAGQPRSADLSARRPLVLTAVAGFVIGSGVLGLLWVLAGVSSGAQDDARAACAAMDRIGEIPLPVDPTANSAVTPGMLNRVNAAKDLANAAAELDPNYQELADHVDGVSRMVISLNFGSQSGRRHLLAVTQICART